MNGYIELPEKNGVISGEISAPVSFSGELYMASEDAQAAKVNEGTVESERTVK